jgi:lipid-binding SYLF domain-containing protein
MKKNTLFALLTLLLTATLLGAPNRATAASAMVIDVEVNQALQHLYRVNPVAKQLSEEAKGILVFPDVFKAGFLVGGQYGDGALVRDGKIEAYYRTFAASYGLQAGAKKFGYAMFFMSDSALQYLSKSDGWEVGVGPTIVVVDKGWSKSLTTTTIQDKLYTFFFDEDGLMAGMGVQGTKITQITPDK